MGNNEFVLMFSVFMVVATVLLTVSTWDQTPAPQKPVPRYSCGFDEFCQGLACNGPLPSDIIILSGDDPDSSFFYHEDAPDTSYPLQTVQGDEWLGQKDGRAVQMIWNRSGALKYREYSGPETDGPVVAHGVARCRDLSDTSREQG